MPSTPASLQPRRTDREDVSWAVANAAAQVRGFAQANRNAL